MPTLLERYRAGEHEQVWTELLDRGATMRTEPLWLEALGVARETMTRARANIERLVSRLHAISYEFNTDYGLQPWMPPSAEATQQLAALEDLVGPIPLSVRTWYEVVGSVNFRGSHPEWKWTNFVLPDPLVVYPLEWVLEECAQRLQDEYWLQSEESAQNYLVIAPDDYHKDDVSGGAPYTIGVPNPAADAIIMDEWHQTTFVRYLRLCFQWGGFPGFARYDERPGAMLAALSADLLPL